jgi:hypothetical protein
MILQKGVIENVLVSMLFEKKTVCVSLSYFLVLAKGKMEPCWETHDNMDVFLFVCVCVSWSVFVTIYHPIET